MRPRLFWTRIWGKSVKPKQGAEDEQSWKEAGGGAGGSERGAWRDGKSHQRAERRGRGQALEREPQEGGRVAPAARRAARCALARAGNRDVPARGLARTGAGRGGCRSARAG